MTTSANHSLHTKKETSGFLTEKYAVLPKNPTTPPPISDGELIQRIYKDLERSIGEMEYSRHPLPTEIPCADKTPPCTRG